MIFMPASIPSAHRALASKVGFALLAVSAAFATSGMESLAELRHIPVPLFPGIGLTLAGLVIGGRKLWPAIVLGSIAALLIRPTSYPLAIEVAASFAEAGLAWLGARLLLDDGDAEFVRPSGLQLIAIGSGIVVVSALGTLLGALLRGTPFDSLETLHAFATVAPVQAILAISVLAWPSASRGAHRRRTVAMFVAALIGFAALSLTAMYAIDVAPGMWTVVPLLIWSAFAFRRKQSGAAIALLATAGATFVLFGPLGVPGPTGPLSPQFELFFGMITTAGLLIDAVGVERQNARTQVENAQLRDQRLTAFVADAPVAIAALNRDLRYIVVSRRYLQDLGLESLPAIIRRTPAEVMPRYAAHLGDGPMRALAGETVSCPVTRIIMHDGTCEYLRSELQPWFDGDGSIGGIMVYGEIVTESVRSRAALEEAETRYHAIFEQAEAGFARCALDGRFLEVNDRFCEITGHDRAALLAKTYRDITHPLDLTRDEGLVRALLEHRSERFSDEKRYITRDGNIVWVNLSAAMIRDRDGNPLYTAAAIQDITARREAQAALAKSELRLRLAQSAAGAGLWEIDFDRNVLIASPDLLRMHGIAPERTSGIPLPEWRALFDRQTREQFKAQGFGTRETDAHDSIYAIQLPDGGRRWVRSIGRRYETAEGRKRIIGLAIDVTAAQEAQAELRSAQATMLRVSHLSAMGSVAATLAHELNQPLAAIVNYIEVCAQILKAEPGQVSPQLLDAVLAAQSQTMRAGNVVQKMRTLTSNPMLSRRRQTVSAMIENACAMIAHEAATEQVVIHRLHASAPLEICADQLQIEQVVVAIFRSAMEAMRGSADRQIRVETTRDGDMATIRITDTGPPPPLSVQEGMFEPFGNSKGLGSGLALPVCRTIVESHEGKLTAVFTESQPTTFVIMLPLAPPPDVADESLSTPGAGLTEHDA